MTIRIRHKISFVILLIWFSSVPAKAQEISWNSHKFGAVCCINETWIKSIQSFSNGDVCLMLDYISPAGSFLRSTDNGKSWDNKLGEYNIYSAAEYSGKFLLSDFTFEPAGSQIFLVDSLTDSVKSWKKFDKGFTSTSPVRSFVVNSNKDIFAATEFQWFIYPFPSRIFYHEEGDSTWEQRNEGLPDSIEITTMIVTKNNSVLIGSLEQGIFRTTNDGNLWSRVNIGNNNLSISSLRLNGTGNVFAATNIGILISKDDGINWEFINTGLPSTGVYSLAINNENILYTLGKDDILYYSSDDGSLWQPMQNTPTLGYLFKNHFLEINSRGYLFLTNINMIYFSSNPVTEVSAEEVVSNRSSYNLLQNYPNPFNPSTTISYELPVQGWVSLKVYDLLGKEVCTLVNEEQSAGHHKIDFNRAELQSGVYFYSMVTGSRSYSRKMIILK